MDLALEVRTEPEAFAECGPGKTQRTRRWSRARTSFVVTHGMEQGIHVHFPMPPACLLRDLLRPARTRRATRFHGGARVNVPHHGFVVGEGLRVDTDGFAVRVHIINCGFASGGVNRMSNSGSVCKRSSTSLSPVPSPARRRDSTKLLQENFSTDRRRTSSSCWPV